MKSPSEQNSNSNWTLVARSRQFRRKLNAFGGFVCSVLPSFRFPAYAIGFPRNPLDAAVSQKTD
jgi:hypothetical protein